MVWTAVRRWIILDCRTRWIVARAMCLLSWLVAVGLWILSVEKIAFTTSHIVKRLLYFFFYHFI